MRQGNNNAEDKKVYAENDIIKIVSDYLQSSGFSDRKLTDTPTDNLQVVNRKYVNLNGSTALRPTTSILGQFYFDTSINKPIWWRGDAFVDAAGNVV